MYAKASVSYARNFARKYFGKPAFRSYIHFARKMHEKSLESYMIVHEKRPESCYEFGSNKIGYFCVLRGVDFTNWARKYIE
jgi:hypothetical protein